MEKNTEKEMRNQTEKKEKEERNRSKKKKKKRGGGIERRRGGKENGSEEREREGGTQVRREGQEERTFAIEQVSSLHSPSLFFLCPFLHPSHPSPLPSPPCTGNQMALNSGVFPA